MYNTKYFD